MSLRDLPDQLVAHISSYVDYSNICNLKETNKNNFTVIKSYRKDNAKFVNLRLLYFYDLKILQAGDISKNYSFKNLEYLKGTISKRIIQILDECSSIDNLILTNIDLTTVLYNYLMEKQFKIRYIYVLSERMCISADNLLKFCEKFPRVVFTHKCFSHAIWNDEILTKIVPGCSIIRDESVLVDNQPGLITNATLNALIGEHSVTNDFSISGVQNTFSIYAIVEKIKMFGASCETKEPYEDELYSTEPRQWRHIISLKLLDNQDVVGLSLDLGTLRPDQAAEAERYFDHKSGELSEQYNMNSYVCDTVRVYLVESLVPAKFRVKFCVYLSP